MPSSRRTVTRKKSVTRGRSKSRNRSGSMSKRSVSRSKSRSATTKRGTMATPAAVVGGSGERTYDASARPIPCALPMWVFLIALVGGGSVGAVSWHQRQANTFNILQALLSFFCLLNSLIAVWEIVLFFKIGRIHDLWIEYKRTYKGNERGAGLDFFLYPVSFGNMFTPNLWAEVWARYGVFDPSYASQTSFGNCTQLRASVGFSLLFIYVQKSSDLLVLFFVFVHTSQPSTIAYCFRTNLPLLLNSKMSLLLLLPLFGIIFAVSFHFAYVLNIFLASLESQCPALLLFLSFYFDFRPSFLQTCISHLNLNDYAGFWVDVGNGFTTLLPSLLFFCAMTTVSPSYNYPSPSISFHCALQTLFLH